MKINLKKLADAGFTIEPSKAVCGMNNQTPAYLTVTPPVGQNAKPIIDFTPGGEDYVSSHIPNHQMEELAEKINREAWDLFAKAIIAS